MSYLGLEIKLYLGGEAFETIKQIGIVELMKKGKDIDRKHQD